ncbi:MAG: SpoIID/LytB domain-containing protein [Cyanobacteria bacterium J06632_22]
MAPLTKAQSGIQRQYPALGRSSAILMAGVSLIWGALPGWSQVPLNPEIRVGIVQRFGEEDTDQITLLPLSGDQLTIQYETGGEPQTLTTNQVVLDTGLQALPQPALQERVVISTHRSFESAEDSANRWRARGIETEIAQPNSWQVWGKREVYNTPLLRRLLLESLQGAGNATAFVDSQVLTEVPKSAFIADGYRYNRDVFSITSANRRIQVRQNGRTRIYAGDLKLQPNVYGTYTLVNQVPIELYLRGVVPHEVGPSAPRQAKEAQAVLARTYALRNLRRFAIDGYELCADTQCQVYRGLSETVPAADAAIAATQGQVLTYNDELVDALYSSTTGGISARFSDVWDGPNRPYLRPVVDSVQVSWDLALRPLSEENNFRAFINLDSGFNEETWPTFRWDRFGTVAEISAGVKEYLSNRQHPLASMTTVTDLQVIERSDAGRVQKLAVSTDVGSFELSKNEVVSALIPPRSQLFYIEPVYEETESSASSTASVAPAPILEGYRFIGGGFGHGVGMSQTGSYNLGRLGWSYDRILSFYYPGTELKPITNDIVFWRPITDAASPSETGAQSPEDTAQPTTPPESATSEPGPPEPATPETSTPAAPPEPTNEDGLNFGL